MRALLLASLLFVTNLFGMTSMQHYLFDEQKKPAPALLALLQLLEPSSSCKTYEEIVALTQQRWYQKGKERWELEERYPEKKTRAFVFLEALGCISEKLPQEKSYDYALYMGGYGPRMVRRLNFLIEQWKQGIRFNTLVILAGKRKLDPSEMPPPNVHTETELFLHLYHEENLPEDLKKIPLVIIDTPLQNGRRPNTADTIIHWLKESPRPGTCLAVGDQPFAGYFDAVFRTHLHSPFEVDVACCDADRSLSLALYLDNLARWLYQEGQIR